MCRTAIGGDDAGEITVRNTFIPPEEGFRPDGEADSRLYGFHYGMVITALTPRQATLVRRHLSRIPPFARLAARVQEIDYAAYQGYGNHYDRIAARYERSITGRQRRPLAGR